MGDSSQVARELGVLSESVRQLDQRAGEDRKTFTNSLDKLHETVDAMRREQAAVAQTIQSTATQVTGIAQERAGARITELEHAIIPDGKTRMDAVERAVFKKVEGADPIPLNERVEKMEDRLEAFDKWMGRGWQFFARVCLVILGASAVSGGIINIAGGLAAWFAAHWTGTPHP